MRETFLIAEALRKYASWSKRLFEAPPAYFRAASRRARSFVEGAIPVFIFGGRAGYFYATLIAFERATVSLTKASTTYRRREIRRRAMQIVDVTAKFEILSAILERERFITQKLILILNMSELLIQRGETRDSH